MDKRFFIVMAATLLAFVGNGQNGGRYAFEFLSLPTSARLTALGGSLVGAMEDRDVNLAWANPALLNANMHQQIAINHNFHFAGISNGQASYGHWWEKYKMASHISASYINYGDFVKADVLGNLTGTFNGREVALTVGAGKQVNERINAGVNLKLISGALDDQSSIGMAADLGITYARPASNRSLALVVKNIGSQLSAYGSNTYRTPLDIQIGYTNRLRYLPFRFSIIAHQLQRWDVRYDDPDRGNTTNIFGESQERSPLQLEVENFFRHMIFNGEFLIGKQENFNLRVGYNHLRRRELSTSEFRSIAGFSLGIGFQVKQFKLDYGVGYYHLAGAANHLSISTNLSRFKKEKSVE